jgi:plastocyanin
MHKAHKFIIGAVAVIALATPDLRGQPNNKKKPDNRGGGTIEIVDDCDPNDPGWAPTGGCLTNGDVTLAEFNTFLTSPLYDNIPPPGDDIGSFLVGHPSWRNEPSHLAIDAGDEIEVKNVGGRAHTFTAVAQFGGGAIPPLNVGAVPAPECATAVRLAPGAETTMVASGDGIQRFQCCIHPWMRATVRVVKDDDN